MDNVKISVSIVLPGSTLTCKKDEKDNTYKEISNASQSINMTQEAYDFMISNEAPYGIKKFEWSRATKSQRIRKHLDKICQHLGGKSYTFTVFED